MEAEALRQRKVAALGLKGVAPANLSALEKLHFLVVLLPQLFLIIPATIIWHHVLYRPFSPIVNVLGRSAVADFMVRVSKFFIGNMSAVQGGLILDRIGSYEKVSKSSVYKGYYDWVKRIEYQGVTGTWIAEPNTVRSEDEVVLLFVHGGGFTLDSGGSSQIFWLKLIKEMHNVRKIKFSIFLVDYELAPQHPYPSQIIESLAALHYLKNHLGISEEKICLSGDSAGGNIIAGLLLHLARPNPKISLPASFGPTPSRPGSVIFVSPHINILTNSESTKANAGFDCLAPGFGNFAALDYIGVYDDVKPFTAPSHVPSFNPLHLFSSPYPLTIKAPLSKLPYVADGEGLELFSSPYVNPVVCQDLDWWKEACPEGRTMVIYGGKELLHDDIFNFITVLDKAGVAPERVYKEYGMHDWIFFDEVIPLLHRTPAIGPDSKRDYGLKKFAAFLQINDQVVRQKFWDEKKAVRN